MHLGHHESLIKPLTDDPKTVDAETLLLEEQRKIMVEAQIDMMNSCIKNRCALERWKNIINLMMLKEAGDCKIHCLRVMHLPEADFNLSLAVKWRKLMHHAVDNHSLNNSQHGGIPGKDSIAHALVQQLQCETTRATREPIVTNDYDATACHDRIIENIASLAGRSCGQHKTLCFVHVRFLSEAKHLLKTQPHMSDEDFKHC